LFPKALLLPFQLLGLRDASYETMRAQQLCLDIIHATLLQAEAKLVVLPIPAAAKENHLEAIAQRKP